NPVPAHLDRPCKVGDILSRRWLLIDVDPVKPTGHKDNPATDAEHAAAQSLAFEVREHLFNLGWPLPLLIDSGNGWHLLYRVELPNDEHSRELLKAILHALAKEFDGDRGTIDRSVHNASRIARLPGTRCRKGVATSERPHRWCRLVEAPEQLVVTAEQLAQ